MGSGIVREFRGSLAGQVPGGIFQPLRMEFASCVARSIASHPVDFATEAHDLGLHRGQRQVAPRSRQGQQAGQALGFGKRRRRFRQPLILLRFPWTHGYSPPPRGAADSGTILIYSDA